MVVVEENRKARRVPVTTGVSDDNFTVIERGISPGDKVVTLSAFPVRDGATVLSGGKGTRPGGPPGVGGVSGRRPGGKP